MLKRYFIDDFSEPRRRAQRIIAEHVSDRGNFSFSYIAMMLSSTVVCTLGLITNSTAVIIGGMIISPLMWPLAKIAYGMSTNRTKVFLDALAILMISIIVILAGAALVAILSPLKQETAEILARTTPTTLEIFIAFAAAVISALAITHPRINESVAGVAIATSLVPPLCVAGIGIAYFSPELAYGSFLLFLANVVTIILTSTVIFSLFVYGKGTRAFGNRQTFGLLLLLLAISWPLTVQLSSAVANASYVSQSKFVLQTKLTQYAPNSELKDFKVTVHEDEHVSVRALVLLPPGRTLTYEQQQEMRVALRESLKREVDLELVLQDSLETISQKSVSQSQQRQELESGLEKLLEEIDPFISIDSVNSNLTGEGWDVAATLRATDEQVVSIADAEEIERRLGEQLAAPVRIRLEVIRSRVVTTGSTRQARDKAKIARSVASVIPGAKVLTLTIKDAGGGVKEVTMKLAVPANYRLTEPARTRLTAAVSAAIGSPVRLEVNTIAKQP